VRAGGEAALLALAWQRGADPYCLYNGLDASYRPLSLKQDCPACLAVRNSAEPCRLCGHKGFIEIPREEPGEPTPPPFPKRLRNFFYGATVALEERTIKAQAAGKLG